MIDRHTVQRIAGSFLAVASLVSTLGAAPVAAASENRPSTAGSVQLQASQIHVVQRGDTLYGISRRYGTTVQAIMAANGLTSTTIYVGQRLVIPGYTPGPGQVYVVQRGDTLSSIAYRYRTTVRAIMAANGLTSTTIYVGQRLVIPGYDPGPQPGPGQVYIVQRGDTLSGIAYRYGTTVQAIMAANGLTSTTIYVGQRLVIPGYRPDPGRRSYVEISPSSGPSGTQVMVVARGFPPYAIVSVGYGPVNSEFTEVTRGQTDANGTFFVRVPIHGEVGMQWVFGVTTDGEQAISAPFTITN